MPLSSLSTALKLKALLLALGCVATSGAASADNLNKLTQRQFIHTANKTCHWLSGPEALALGGGLIQMRNAALISGQNPHAVYATIHQAHTAAARADCRNPALLAEVETVKAAYRGFVTQNRLTFGSAKAKWLTDRTEADTRKWRLVQYQKTGDVRMALGIYGHLDRHVLTAMIQFPDDRRPYSARLMVRDPKYRPSGVIDKTPLGLSASMPLNITRYDQTFMAQNRHMTRMVLEDAPKVNMAGFNVMGEYKGRPETRPTIRFDFPIYATTAIARLDPREDIVVVFEFADGPQYARFEAGDFVPGLVFATLPSLYGK